MRERVDGTAHGAYFVGRACCECFDVIELDLRPATASTNDVCLVQSGLYLALGVYLLVLQHVVALMLHVLEGGSHVHRLLVLQTALEHCACLDAVHVLVLNPPLRRPETTFVTSQWTVRIDSGLVTGVTKTNVTNHENAITTKINVN